jgi:uncharacterized small protein (DUF1192 family)
LLEYRSSSCPIVGADHSGGAWRFPARSGFILQELTVGYCAIMFVLRRIAMDLDELFARRPDDPLVALLKQDIDRLSLDELQERVEALKGEIARCESKIAAATSHRSAADALFRKAD